jgi:hypothetical protein
LSTHHENHSQDGCQVWELGMPSYPVLKLTLSHELTMDVSSFRQTWNLEFGKFISTAEKGIINSVKLRSLVTKYRKIWKIQSCEVCEFWLILYYAWQSDDQVSKRKDSAFI